MNGIKKATRQQLKSHNKTLTLKTIYDHLDISRADIARQTRLTRPTVSSAVEELMAEGLVEETGQGPSANGGKPPTLLRVVPDSRHLIAIDLASHAFRGGIVDLRGNVLHSLTCPVENRDGQAALELAYDLIDDLVAWSQKPLLGIGLGTPGLVDAHRGLIRTAVNLDWQELPLRDLLHARYDLPVYIANGTQVAALGEYTFGQHPDTANLIVIKVGHGLSAGIVLNGTLLYGDGGGAGEIGHVVVVENGDLCRCGHTGCLETVASSQAIIKQAQALAQTDPASLLHRFAASPEIITLETVQQALAAGDEAVQDLVAEAGRYLGIAVAHLVGALNINCVLIGGSLAHLGQPLLETIRTTMHQRALPLLADNTRVGFSHLGDNIVMLGAAALLLTHELGVV